MLEPFATPIQYSDTELIGPLRAPRQMLAAQQYRRTESLWIRTRVFARGSEDVLASMLLNAAHMKDSYPGYEEEQRKEPG
jgi:hypothetical protein